MRAAWTISIFLSLAVIPQPQTAAPPETIEHRVDALLARMTLEEKLGQMSQSTSMATPLSDEIKQQIRDGRWGSFLNAGNAADRAEAQRIATKESRLGIPLIFGRDVIHGYKTVFPIPLGQSASWDPDLISAAAHQAALEATADGIQWTFAPMIDIARDPRWGRVAESLGEDPYVGSLLGAAMVRGFQGDSLDRPDSLAACAKHFAGYGAAEGGRDYNSAWIPEILLRDVYLRPFRAAITAGVATFMTSFNTLNAIPATGNRFLLRDILRGEWKYTGMVVSDYQAITEMTAHGYTVDARDAARKALGAGVDMEMVSTAYFDHLKALLETRQVTIKQIDGAVRNILRLKFRMGLFDDRPEAETHPDTEALDVAQRLATESIVLLKNAKGLLPLSKKIGKLAVVGPLANSQTDQMGTWAMDGVAENVRTPLAALRQMLGSDRVTYAPALSNSRDLSTAQFAAALRVARQSDAVVLFLGEEASMSGEARSRAFLNLPGAQEQLVDQLASTGKPLIAVIMAGRPLTFHQSAEKLDAILYAWHPGTMGGPAIASLLFGDSVPSGKLTISFPRSVGQVPIYYSHLSTGRPPSPNDLGTPMGTPENPKDYTSRYIDLDFTPEYPFGYGLSYTTFQYSETRISAPALASAGDVTISADVANPGSRDADEVVQLYINGPAGGSVARPVRELRGFTRVHLKAGEAKTVGFSIQRSDLAYYNNRMQLSAEPGTYRAWVAPDSTGGTPVDFTVK
jgi:beta-glucosidase